MLTSKKDLNFECDDKFIITSKNLSLSVSGGTTTTEGIGLLSLGNSTARGSAGNYTGTLRIYNQGTGYIDIVPLNASSSSYTIKLPNIDGILITDSKIKTVSGGEITGTTVSFSYTGLISTFKVFSANIFAKIKGSSDIIVSTPLPQTKFSGQTIRAGYFQNGHSNTTTYSHNGGAVYWKIDSNGNITLTNAYLNSDNTNYASTTVWWVEYTYLDI